MKGDEKITLDDLSKARLTRDMLENQCMSDRFEEYVKGKAFDEVLPWMKTLIGTYHKGLGFDSWLEMTSKASLFTGFVKSLVSAGDSTRLPIWTDPLRSRTPARNR